MLYFTLYTTASLPMMLGPKAQALSYLVPTKYLFLPYSQTHLSETPFFAVGLSQMDIGNVDTGTTYVLMWLIIVIGTSGVRFGL